MGFKSICKQGAQLYLDDIFPERMLARKMQKHAERYPKTAIAIEILVSVILGLLKVLLIPCASAYACASLPLRALFNCIKTKSCQNLPSYCMAWIFNLMTIAITVGLIFSLIFIPPPVVFVSLGILISLTTSASLFQTHKNLFPDHILTPSNDYIPLISEAYFDQDN
ncbi:hypothetical protein C10C_0408 [Chlamydia serpentis]|uniref:Uncharacterized protein n=1 Tax=Chlamydia serpentis TaxID=1967782 RepID=A0A2R8FBF2_9CHLA|nr:DUF5422 family protein [Chlamydia serpentis]SPN73577.1 hypothetical protein C10C_0408 [Chlamydia serpentis]